MKFKLGGFANPKEKLSVGLDIGSGSIKSVQLRFRQSGVELCEFGLTEIPADTGRAVAGFTQPRNIKLANISVSGPSTLIRYVNFPKMDPSELQQALKFEAQKHIPFPVDEVNLDGYILKPDLPGNLMLVLLAAVKNDLISGRLKLMEEAGVKPNLIDIDSVALINAYNFNYPVENSGGHRVVALVNIGASMANLNILEDGIPRLSRDIHTGGAVFTQKLADIFAVDLAAAEKLKLSPEGENRDKVRAAMEPMLANLGQEIRTSFDFYESQSAVSVGKILVSGGSSYFSGLKDMLSASTGIAVEDWDPFNKISLAGGVDAAALKKVSSQLAVAVGLALRQ
ncbi:MAG: type IV pilus assembly protein PilM [Candidatus Omnitrophota bacterium]|nr:type IV pilus assembly protein PilM [Candidatus Omnitrophota bacterium]